MSNEQSLQILSEKLRHVCTYVYVARLYTDYIDIHILLKLMSCYPISLHHHLSTYSDTCVCVLLNRVQLFATPWTAACQAPLSMGFPKEEYWSGLPFPPPGDLPNSGIEPLSPALAGRFFTTEPPEKRCVLELRSLVTCSCF